jgi:hypothetical protein
MKALLTPGATANVPLGPDSTALPAMSTLAPARGAIATPAAGTQTFELEQTIDLTSTTRAWLQLDSWLPSSESHAEIQVTADGVNWESITVSGEPDNWTTLDIDLSAYAGSTIRVRFVFDGPSTPGWRLRGVKIRARFGPS